MRIAIAVLLVACGGGAGDAVPPCSAAGARFVDIAKRELAAAETDEVTSRAVLAQLPAMRDALVQACTEGKWSAQARNCLVRANDHGDFEACEQQLTDEQRRNLDRASRGTPDAP